MSHSPALGSADYERMADQVRAVRDGVDDVRVTTYSPDGLVRVVVGGRGQLLELELDPRIYRDQDSTALAATIRDAVREAARDAERATAEIVERMLAQREDSDGGDHGGDRRFGPVLSVLGAERRKGERRWPA